LLFDGFDLLQGVREVCVVRGYISSSVWTEEEEKPRRTYGPLDTKEGGIVKA
jgi:hypothetical protein